MINFEADLGVLIRNLGTILLQVRRFGGIFWQLTLSLVQSLFERVIALRAH